MSRKIEEIKKSKANNSRIKKISLSLLLIAIMGVVAYVVLAKPNVEKQTQETKSFTQAKEEIDDNGLIDTIDEGLDMKLTAIRGDKEVTITNLKDGTLYTISGESLKPEIIIGNNYFDTQLSDININFTKYEGKTIEIEGFFIEDTPYTFIGRYSESNLCAYCPQGYSYFEYEWHGNNAFSFTNEQEWLKVVGTLRRGTDEFGEYYYIDASSIKVMNERGQDTVKN